MTVSELTRRCVLWQAERFCATAVEKNQQQSEAVLKRLKTTTNVARK